MWIYPWLKKKWVIKDNKIQKRTLPNKLNSNSKFSLLLKKFWKTRPYPTRDVITAKYDNKKIIELDQAYKKIFSSNNLFENLNKINGEFEGNELVQEVTKFIEKDKKRPICSPLSEKWLD